MELSKSEYEVATMLVRALVQHGLKCYGESQSERLHVAEHWGILRRCEAEWKSITQFEKRLKVEARQRYQKAVDVFVSCQLSALGIAQEQDHAEYEYVGRFDFKGTLGFPSVENVVKIELVNTPLSKGLASGWIFNDGK